MPDITFYSDEWQCLCEILISGFSETEDCEGRDYTRWFEEIFWIELNTTSKEIDTMQMGTDVIEKVAS